MLIAARVLWLLSCSVGRARKDIYVCTYIPLLPISVPAHLYVLDAWIHASATIFDVAPQSSFWPSSFFFFTPFDTESLAFHYHQFI